VSANDLRIDTLKLIGQNGGFQSKNSGSDQSPGPTPGQITEFNNDRARLQGEIADIREETRESLSRVSHYSLDRQGEQNDIRIEADKQIRSLNEAFRQKWQSIFPEDFRNTDK